MAKLFTSWHCGKGGNGRRRSRATFRILYLTMFFPNLVQAIAFADSKPGMALDDAYLDDVRKGALILLYRLLFVLYAEDRNLLPDESGPYADYSLTKLRV